MVGISGIAWKQDIIVSTGAATFSFSGTLSDVLATVRAGQLQTFLDAKAPGTYVALSKTRLVLSRVSADHAAQVLKQPEPVL